MNKDHASLGAARDGADDAARAVERAARESYGRLMAILAGRTRDLAAAEDALGDALTSALDAWPREGVPANPAGWILTAARRRLIDGARRAGSERAALSLAARSIGFSDPLPCEDGLIPDERLRLLFACAHPLLDASDRAPLMLQCVLGIRAKDIASAFLVSPSSMAQRLVRAKHRLREHGAGFDAPGASESRSRMGAVAEAVYAAYCVGWDAATLAQARRKPLAEEAVWLGRSLAEVAGDWPEAPALLALMLYCESRLPARRGPKGEYIPLAEQDASLWCSSLIDEAEAALTRAAESGSLGRFQLEAAIQSAHAARRNGGATDWAAIALLYEGLVRLAPSVGAMVGRAAALGEHLGPARGLAALDDIPGARVAAYQPYWATRGEMLRRLGKPGEAEQAYTRAAGLSDDPGVRAFLLLRAAVR